MLSASFPGTADLVGGSDAIGFPVSCPAGLDGVACYLGAFKTTLTAAPDDRRQEGRPQAAAQDGVRKLEKLVTKARIPGKKGAKATKKLGKQLDALGQADRQAQHEEDGGDAQDVALGARCQRPGLGAMRAGWS